MIPTESSDVTSNARRNRRRRERAMNLVVQETRLWLDEDIALLLLELEIEIGEGMNRFMYHDERMPYCEHLSQTVSFHQPKSTQEIHDKIVWLWTTWEAISKATGKSWWSITEADRHKLSLMKNDEDQRLIDMFKYYYDCDKIFPYIKEEDERRDDDEEMFGAYY